MKKVWGTIVFSVLLGSQAVAADLPVKAAPSVAPAPPWSGAYVGAHGGYGWGTFTNSLVDSPFAAPVEDLGSISAKGWLGGGHIGVNRQWGNIVVGGELSASLAGIDGSTSCLPGGTASDCKSSLDWLVMGMGRLGWAGGNWMLYAQGGAAVAGFTSEWTNATSAPAGFARGTATAIGGAAGVGLEYMVAPGVVAGVDYVHLFFRDGKTMFVDDVWESLNTDLRDVNIVRARISVLWGSGGAPAYARGMVTKAPPASVIASVWDGVYAGGHAGYGWGKINNTLVTDSTAAPVGNLGSISAKGWIGGAHVGVNRQWGNVVVGGELSASLAGMDGSTSCTPAGTASECKSSLDWLVMGMGRLGWASGNWLLYGQAGAAIAGFTSEWTNAVSIPAGFARGTATTIGGAAGVGLEYMVAPGVVAGVDYVHLFFRDGKTMFVDDVWEALNSEMRDVNIVRARLSVLWGGSGAPARAHGMVTKAPPVSVVASAWNGAYVGAHGGYGWGKFVNSRVPDSLTTPADDLGSISADGWIGGAHVGVNRQWGNVVVGAELSASLAGIKDSNECLIGGAVAGTCKSSLDWLIMGLGRLGWASGNWMLYAQGGAAIAGFTSELTTTFAGGLASGAERGTATTIGAAAGAGLEYMVMPGVVAGVDYVHLFFRDGKTMFVDDVFDSLNTELRDVDIVRARISVLWGGR